MISEEDLIVVMENSAFGANLKQILHLIKDTMKKLKVYWHGFLSNVR